MQFPTAFFGRSTIAAVTRQNDDRYVDATPARHDDDEPLTPEQVESWRSDGFTLVDGVVPETLIAELQAAAEAEFPSVGADTANADPTGSVAELGSAVNFPARLSGFNEATLHPRLLGAVGQLLGREPSGLRLSQSDLWPKYGQTQATPGPEDGQDQRIHIDYPNHTLAHPAPWDRPEAVEMILYLSDHADCGGSTALVPRTGPDDPAYRWPIVDSPGIVDLNYINDRDTAETYFAEHRPELADWRQSLYERERWTRFRPGTIVFYRHDTWHRGTPLTPGARRLAQNMTYRRAECEWISTLHVGWAWKMYEDDQFMERLIAQASLDQRAVLGFPQPGNDYWCAETIQAVHARYGVFGFDPSPYQQALNG